MIKSILGIILIYSIILIITSHTHEVREAPLHCTSARPERGWGGMLGERRIERRRKWGKGGQRKWKGGRGGREEGEEGRRSQKGEKDGKGQGATRHVHLLSPPQRFDCPPSLSLAHSLA
jgi:hypothetical protein